MHNVETYSQSYLGNYQMPLPFKKRAIKIALENSCSSLRKESIKECKSSLKPIFPKTTITHKYLQKKIEYQRILLDEACSQIKHHISLIEDPLWRRVCAEVIDIMGPFAFQIVKTHLGTFAFQDKTMNLYCQTDEIFHFVQEYNFIILESLRRYFPTLKELRVKVPYPKYL